MLRDRSFITRNDRHLAPYQRLLDMRMEESSRLLQETDHRITQIGEQVGYPAPLQFSAFFRSRQGSSPTTYRAMKNLNCR